MKEVIGTMGEVFSIAKIYGEQIEMAVQDDRSRSKISMKGTKGRATISRNDYRPHSRCDMLYLTKFVLGFDQGFGLV